MKLDGQLAQLVTEAGGRSLPAVKALLDMDRFLESKEPQQELKEAVEQLRQQQSWLFRQERNPAPPLPGKPAKEKEQSQTQKADAFAKNRPQAKAAPQHRQQEKHQSHAAEKDPSNPQEREKPFHVPFLLFTISQVSLLYTRDS